MEKSSQESPSEKLRPMLRPKDQKVLVIVSIAGRGRNMNKVLRW